MATGLPTFEKPPLVEVVFGLQFNPIPGLGAATLGGYIKSLEPHWTTLAEISALGQIRPEVTEAPFFPLSGLVWQEPGLRMRAWNNAHSEMLQVENGWFVHNWRGQEKAQYPRFESIKKRFEAHQTDFLAFLKRNDIASITPNMWDLSYVNFIRKGECWQRPADWHEILPTLLGSAKISVLAPLQTMKGQWVFLLPDGQGVLQVLLDHAIIPSDSPEEVLVLKLIARGPLQTLGSYHGYESGHKAIVTAFAELLSDEVRQQWGYRA